MAEILFYHLTRSRVDAALPTLVQRSLDRGWRVGIALGEENADALSKALWDAGPDTFLAHGIEGTDEAEGQPVWLATSDPAANDPQVVFAIGGAAVEGPERFQRTVVMFDAHREGAEEAARTQWKALKGDGHDLTYWQQDDDGRWTKKG